LQGINVLHFSCSIFRVKVSSANRDLQELWINTHIILL
jgi:hypothetical protein